ncbi:copper amine oxidase N-terminal domain-containing protein [Paenibacillus albidus]|uniref:copper amine oxidase N-terminal domain-containing protein n=1 Tax=Paenibacillus albidus TaxID=2041023 RepID=UPI001BEC1753|nr:copper amine oxidase N-terminal domain-containing protein [Paenibacillus albidus]MBT2289487.1 copper amine oxidase N-terminal domain-containing protein [Paenibacillus albidus]
MRKLGLVAVLSIFIMLSVFYFPGRSGAADVSPRIKDVQMDTLLMDDGTIWLKRPWAASGYQKVNVGASAIYSAERAFSEFYDYGISSKGELILWNNGSLPTVDATQNDIKLVTGQYYLKNDGTVWSLQSRKQIESLTDISLLATGFRSTAYVTNSGEIHHSYVKYVADKVADSSSIVALKLVSDRSLAYMDNTGKVVFVDLLKFDYNNGDVKYFPQVVTTDAAYIESAGEDQLLVTKKDGTAWLCEPTWSGTSKSFQLVTQISGITNAVKVTPYEGSLADKPRDEKYKSIVSSAGGQKWLVLQTNGSWNIYGDGSVTQVEPPAVSGLTLTASNSKPAVGNTIQFKIIQTYNNGYKETLSGKEGSLQVDKPYLLQEQNDGSYKVLGVGDSKITATAAGNSKTITVTASLGANLTGAVNANGIIMLPIKSVFKSLGGTVTYDSANQSYNVQMGLTAIRLTNGRNTATVNGKEVTLSSAVSLNKSEAVFPADFLKKNLGAVTLWDSKLKVMKVSIGSGTLVVESADTPQIKKKVAQGNLAGLIGKSYWVNNYNNWERFSKVTVTDILPVGGDNFEIVFANVKGKTLKSEVTSRGFVTLILGDPYTFLTYDPFKKYNWSSSTWNTIKASQIAIGMSKAQVDLSWGKPSSASQAVGTGINVDVWRYGYQYVVFTNGIVTQIYS